MNANIQNRIANMKNQTIGVEVEMNSITRQKAASGSSSGTPALPDRTPSGARW